MISMIASVIEAIRSRSREEYGQLYVDLLNYYRELAQENGEISMVFGVLLGVAVVVFFKVFVVCFVLITVILDGIYLIAEPGRSTPVSNEITENEVSKNGHHAKVESVESHSPQN